MPTMVDVSAPKVEDRAVLATRRLCETLNLGVLKPKDLKNLTTALAEVASEEAEVNRTFAAKILSAFRDLTPVAPAPAPRSRGQSASKPLKPKLKAIRDFDIRTGRKDLLAGQLSGGNQQKLLLAKKMMLNPEIVIIDEPTRGIDIGTKEQIYKFIASLAE